MGGQITWKTVFIGLGILVSGILMILFSNTWGTRTGITNPIGIIFLIASIFVIGWGFRIRFREV